MGERERERVRDTNGGNPTSYDWLGGGGGDGQAGRSAASYTHRAQLGLAFTGGTPPALWRPLFLEILGAVWGGGAGEGAGEGGGG
jgi:hypothetical protein